MLVRVLEEVAKALLEEVGVETALLEEVEAKALWEVVKALLEAVAKAPFLV